MQKNRVKTLGVSLAGAGIAMLFASGAIAGPGSVEVTTVGDIKIKMGAQVRIIPTSETDRDFGLSSGLSAAEEGKAAVAMASLGNGSAKSTKTHLTEAGGAVKDDYIRGENRLFFNFAQGDKWDVYMAIESDTVLDRKSADRTDFALGGDTQQFGIERLFATFKVDEIKSRIEAGWDAKGVDIGYGGLVYGDDDPGIGITGKANGVSWEARYLKKDEDEAGFYTGAANPIGEPVDTKDNDRTFMYGKVGYDIQKDVTIEGFYFLDQNKLSAKKIDHNFVGLQGKGAFGIVKPTFELAYSFGDYAETGKEDRDISAWAGYADVAFDLKSMAGGLKSLEAHLGGYYLQGDDDLTDNDLEGFASAVSIDRFAPRFGTEHGISNDGNPIFGQILYSMFPIYYGSVAGAGINGGAKLDNPGFQMIGGGISAGLGKWTYKTNLMAMWFDEPEAVEAYYNSKVTGANVEIDDFMGIEWNHELIYKLYDYVSIKGGAALLFPGSGAEDITRALNAIAKGTTYANGESSDDISMRLAGELLWFF